MFNTITFSTLPRDIKFLIYSFLPPQDAMTCRRLSKQEREAVWKLYTIKPFVESKICQIIGTESCLKPGEFEEKQPFFYACLINFAQDLAQLFKTILPNKLIGRKGQTRLAIIAISQNLMKKELTLLLALSTHQWVVRCFFALQTKDPTTNQIMSMIPDTTAVRDEQLKAAYEQSPQRVKKHKCAFLDLIGAIQQHLLTLNGMTSLQQDTVQIANLSQPYVLVQGLGLVA